MDLGRRFCSPAMFAVIIGHGPVQRVYTKSAIHARPRSVARSNGAVPSTVTAVSEKSGSAFCGFGAGEQPEIKNNAM